MGLEAKIKPRNRAGSVLNIAVATIKEAPLPVKLVIGGTIGTAAITILYGCNTQSQPCEITANELTDKKVGACPLTTFHYDNPGNVLSADDQAKLRVEYGADISDVYLWYAVNKGSSTESDGDGMVAFSTYYFKNGRSMVVFPSANEDYYSGQAEKHEFISSMFESDEGKIIQSYNYPDKLNPGKVLSFLTIEYQKPDGATLEDISKDPSKLGFPERAIFSNPPANEVITYNVDSKNPDDLKLIKSLASIFGPGPGVAYAQGLSPQELTAQVATPTIIAPTEAPSPTPTEVPTAIPTPAPVEVAPGEFVPASQIIGYEARDTSGKLIYVEDIHGNWIKASHEVIVPVATTEDWTNVNTRLGSDFIISTDGLITGVEGLNINKANGEVTLNVDGKGPETCHIGNIKVQEINGVKRLLVAGYAWNPESKSWEIFNPGFPMESPEAQLGWFTQADIPNGNWLRWHQRATENIDMKALFPADTRVDSWGMIEFPPYTMSDVPDSIIHYNQLGWQNNQIDAQDRKKNGIPKAKYPGREGLSFGYLTDSGSILVSFEALNGDRSTTSLPMILDDILWTEEYRNTVLFTWMALASGHEWDSSMAIETMFGNDFNNIESWFIWPIVWVYPDATSFGHGTGDVEILQKGQGNARREATIQGDKIEPAASLEIWGGVVLINPHN